MCSFNQGRILIYLFMYVVLSWIDPRLIPLYAIDSPSCGGTALGIIYERFPPERPVSNGPSVLQTFPFRNGVCRPMR